MPEKIIISFEVTGPMREFIRKRAKMGNRSVSGYLRDLVQCDLNHWEALTQEAWENWAKAASTRGASHDN